MAQQADEINGLDIRITQPGVQVACPNCSVQFLVVPRVTNVAVLAGGLLSFAFDPVEFRHACTSVVAP